MSGPERDARLLERLYEVIESRRHADPARSHTARLFSQGPKSIARKLGEEALETVIEGVEGDHDRLVSESADLLYHLLVLWAARDVRPEEVWAELGRRQGISGIAEKVARDAE